MTKKIFWVTFIAIALSQISPIITEAPKFFCNNIGDGLIQCGCIKLDIETFFCFRLILIIIVIILYGIINYYNTYQPLNKYNSGRKEVFDLLLAPSLDTYINQGLSLRINVMKARRSIKYFFLCHKLETIYRHGFESKHRDTHLSFWVCKLIKFAQGNCGEAFLSEKPQLADLTEGVPYKYRLSKSKINKTENINGIISIPVFELMNDKSIPKIVGVINIDTNDKNLVKEWVENQDCLSSIVDAFENHAKIVSYFI